MTRRLPVVLMWHMHQPQYRDALTGEYVLPWTYLHALKDYSDMAAHLEENPAARAVVNFTPVLLEQLQEYAQRVANHLRSGAPVRDRVLATLTEAPLPAAAEPRLELLRALLRAHRTHLVERFEGFAEVARIAESLASPERVAWASDQMLWDLATWYHLAWLGETVRRADPRAQDLIRQGRGFAPAQRRKLLGLVAEVLGGIVPRYRALANDGRVELSVTPYGHPILPLLYDFGAAREAQPDASLPRHSGYPGGDDRATWHMAEAIRVFTDTFGFAPTGCWPSEGAVSDDALALIDRFGLRWAATSCNVLRNSVAAERDATVHRDAPYRMPGQQLTCFFRHDGLSDAIGFEYSTWHGDDASAHFAQEVAKLAEQYEHDPGRVLLIALDGENAWEHYPFNGYYFLRGLYAALAAHPRIELTTLSGYLQRDPGTVPLRHVVAGSWVHGTLATWIGDPAKNAGWDLLCEAKHAFDRVVVEGSLDEAQAAAAERQLALCESSDWFWWFGDYNPADAVSQFDRLYRRQLTNLYRLLKLEPPAALAQPLSGGGGSAEHGGTMRRANAG
ncbi:MAG: glycoside hydrolase family 57 protein [Steroidobacteraceae bacterium]|jgi:alpha-amylase/alpha-mannosidase (GH57 family)|nr:glycoside hydrolase family 57 protein [Steroidobacteraceae bacterium]